MKPFLRLLFLVFGFCCFTTSEAAGSRLPLTLKPNSYVIHLAPKFGAEENSFQGRVEISASSDDDTPHNNVFLNKGDNINIISLEVLSENGTDLKGNFAPVQDKDQIECSWESNVTAVTIKIEYNGTITNDLDGFYLSKYLDENGKEKNLAATQFQSNSARRAFPCFDEPALKATFSVSIDVPDGYGAIFNTKNASVDGSVVTFETTNPISSYLVAFLIYDQSSFGFSEAIKDGNPHRVWSRNTLKDQRAVALGASQESITELDKLFPDFKYFVKMNTKIDQVAIPDFSLGGMENWGIIMFRERALLVGSKDTTSAAKQAVIQTVAHEYTHQWFGDLVGPDYWNVLWLSEGFATYWEYHLKLPSYADWKMDEQFVVIELHKALEFDAYETTHPMTNPLEDGEESDGLFDDITYSKAASVIRMMRHMLGEEKFLTGLRNYLNDRQMTSATPRDLFRNLAGAGDIPELELILMTWTDTSGYPVVHVDRDFENKTAFLYQERYFLTNTSKDNATWITPVSYTNSLDFTSTLPTEWIKGMDGVILTNFTDDVPLFVNLQQAGFYRTLYDDTNWELIARQLQKNHSVVPAITRAQLLSDALNLARSGHMTYNIALDLTMYLNQETDYVPWTAALKAFSFINARLADSEANQYFQKYMQGLLEKSYGLLGFSVGKDDTQLDRLQRVNVLTWACRLKYAPCIEDLTTLVSTIDLNNASNIYIEPDLRSVVYCESVRMSGPEIWDLLWEMYMNTAVATEKILILTSLGCTENTTILENYLNIGLDTSKVRSQDVATVYAAVYSNPVGLDIALKSIKEHALELVQGFSGLRKILLGIGNYINTEEHLKLLVNLTDVVSTTNAKVDLEAAIATAKSQISWLNNNRQPVEDWLKAHTGAATTVVCTTFVLSISFLLTAVTGIW